MRGGVKEVVGKKDGGSLRGGVELEMQIGVCAEGIDIV
jgi:hypothetical protein